MIRGRDQVRLSLQKLALRKKRAAFSILSVALGVIVVVTVNSLLEGIRDVTLKTMWTEEIPRCVVKIFANENPYEVAWGDEEKAKKKTKRRFQFLSEAVFEEMRHWSEVEAADRPVLVQYCNIEAFTNQPWRAAALKGEPVALLRRYVSDPALLDDRPGAIPLVVGEHNLRLHYNAKKKKMEFDKETNLSSWLGRELTIVVGDNYASI
jgi:hypothetical protein